jgi:tail tube protein
MSPFIVPGLGYKGKLLIAKETTYDVAPAAADTGMELLSATITPKLSVIEDPSLSNTQVSRRFIGQGGQTLEATFRVRVGYEGLLSLIRMFFPVYANAVVDTSARDHTFKEPSLAVPGFSYALDFLWGDVPAGKANGLTGCLGTALRVSGQAGTGESAMLTAEVTVVGKSLTPNKTPMTGGALPTALGVIYHQLARTTNILRDGSGNASDAIQLRSFEFSLNHPYDVNRFLFGQLNAEQPVRSAFTDATFMFDEEWTDIALMTAARANTPTSLRMMFQHPTVIGAATAKREFEISASSPTAAEYGTELPGFGVITQKASYRLAYNTTDLSLAVLRVRSTEAAMTY